MQLVVAQITLGDREYTVRMRSPEWVTFYTVDRSGIFRKDFPTIEDCFRFTETAYPTASQELTANFQENMGEQIRFNRMFAVLKTLNAERTEEAKNVSRAHQRVCV